MKRSYKYQKYQSTVYRIMLLVACMVVVLIYNSMRA